MSLRSQRVMSARKMVEQYVAGKGVDCPRVLKAMEEVPRELFVPEILRERAYSDHPLPIGYDQTISQPYVVAKMTSALELKGDETILEIGTGSGYQAAILSKLCKRVFSVERIPELARKARSRLEAYGIHNVSVKIDHGLWGWKEFAPFDHIMITASVSSNIEPIFSQLKDGGRLVAPFERRKKQSLFLIEKCGENIKETRICDCSFVPFIS
ncbi:MAG: protein-L-isoaspartate(D-aspartate) O-methyltransferase [Bdellovibrionales bacterium]|nr:protein-L-isoaspartate(D-aspartate) O-methyltransferase [Bdellovibrionales bacterium]